MKIELEGISLYLLFFKTKKFIHHLCFHSKDLRVYSIVTLKIFKRNHLLYKDICILKKIAMKFFSRYRTNLFFRLILYFYNKIIMSREHDVFFFHPSIC